MVRQTLKELLVLQTALEYLYKQDEPKDYDPKGFHVGPREGHYFKPGEREAGGKEVEVVQAPEAESPELDLTERLPPINQTPPDDVPNWIETPDGARAMGGAIPRYWHHRPPGHVAEGTPSGGLQAYNMDPKEIETTSGFYSDKLGHPRPTEHEQFLWMSPVSRMAEGEFVIDITKLNNADMRFTGQAEGNLLHRGDMSPDGIARRPEAEVKDSSYEMPQYDRSLEAYSQQYSDDVKVHNLTEADFEHYERMGMQPDSKIAVISKNVGATLFFGKTKEEAVEKLLTRQINKGVFLPPRLTPKPDWTTNASDPFPNIPPDIKEIHYDDIPEFYSESKYGNALELGNSGGFKGAAKLLARKAGEKDDIKSETFTDALVYSEDGEIDYLESAKKIAQNLGSKVTPGEAKSFIKQIQAKTQDSLVHRGLPEKFYVFKGGKLHGENQIESTSLSPGAASKNYFSQKESEPYVAMYEINRADVLVDVNAIKERYVGHLAAEDEQELVLQSKDLKNPVMIQLPNYMI